MFFQERYVRHSEQSGKTIEAPSVLVKVRISKQNYFPRKFVRTD